MSSNLTEGTIPIHIEKQINTLTEYSLLIIREQESERTDGTNLTAESFNTCLRLFHLYFGGELFFERFGRDILHVLDDISKVGIWPRYRQRIAIYQFILDQVDSRLSILVDKYCAKES